ncbi:hypothetical protein VHP8226_01472 [Vibrio hippocampi]|uniref:Uncharacterized protein n=2 Tax=Vibrio hippocampi TaxID=654686 RepID=A0ABN8DFF8_9VIBR|nr:hypothetical protein VHP8226_01472 [Vibrio hippocampi]
MDTQRNELMEVIEQAFIDYHTMTTDDITTKREKKQFIDGLMTAARVIGVHYEELDALTKAVPIMLQRQPIDMTTPAYIRQLARQIAIRQNENQ